MTPVFFILVLLRELVAPSARTQTEDEAGGAYCGIQCVYAVGKALTHSLQYEALLKSNYVSSHAGSLESDLVAALTDHGLNARPLQNLRLNQLMGFPHPTILHVRTPAMRVVYRHWVLFLGQEKSGLYKLYDPPRGTLTLSASELLAIWDGKGIVVTLPGETFPQDFLPVESLFAVTLVAVSIYLLTSKCRRSLPLILPCTSILAATAWHLLMPIGWLQKQSSLGIVHAAHFELPAATTDIIEHQGSSQRQIIDCRLSSSYRFGAIPTAISLPINSGYGRIKAVMEKIPVERELLFYCQSDRCAWADAMASYFRQQGYKNIMIYRPGHKGYLDEMTKRKLP
jgi:rhodanese-related sulfurtransferase